MIRTNLEWTICNNRKNVCLHVCDYTESKNSFVYQGVYVEYLYYEVIGKLLTGDRKTLCLSEILSNPYVTAHFLSNIVPRFEAISKTIKP